MPVKCQFNLSRSSQVYYTGEQISGTLKLTVSKKPLQVEGISITLLGTSTTSWHESAKCLPQIEHNDSSGPTEPPQLHYGAAKSLVMQTQQLADSLILPPGSMQLGNFTFQLPNDVPASCHFPHGSISYSLQLTLERRSKQAKRLQHRLIVRKRIELLEPRPASTECSTLCLSLPRSVFVPGQRVAYQLETSNLSTHFSTRLCQSVCYESQQPLPKFKKVVRILDESCCLEDVLHLPLTAPIMSHRSCDLIEIAYYLETFASCSEPLRLPLLVGTVAPPVDSHTSLASLGCINYASSENELLPSPINQLLPQSYSREFVTSTGVKHNEQLKLLRRQKKQSYVRIALRYFYKRLLPAN
ncbi:hypothetical protein KR044_007079 [Drosophila immigrans]|nr:hypothetical protein KR044_007079 [Drosophila immigrans]